MLRLSLAYNATGMKVEGVGKSKTNMQILNTCFVNSDCKLIMTACFI